MCDDCQTYAEHLGRADVILDAHGGTEVLQTVPARVRITQGHEHLRCLRLSPKGLMRWYAGCCNTPIGNTLASPGMPFVGVVHTFIQLTDSQARDVALGPVRAKVQGRFSRGPMPTDASRTATPWLILRTAAALLRATLGRQHKPSPFFEPRTGQPVVEPTVLTLEERQRARAQCPIGA